VLRQARALPLLKDRPPRPSFTLFLSLPSNLLALRSLRSVALDVARDILHSFGSPTSIVLQYPSSHSLLIESTQTASIQKYILHPIHQNTLPALRAINSNRCHLLRSFRASTYNQLSRCVTQCQPLPLRLLLCWSRKSLLVDLMCEREICTWLLTRLSLLKRSRFMITVPRLRLEVPWL